MVKREIILKALNDSISKCKKPSHALNSLNNHVKHAFNEFNKKHGIGNTEREYCLSVLKNGETLNENSGDKYSVESKYDEGAKILLEKIASDLTKPLDENEWYDHELHRHFEEELIKRLNETNNGLYHIHNHPSLSDSPLPTYLSDGDCNNTFLNPVHYRTATLYNTVKCQMAVCSNGTSMILINHNPVSTHLGFDEDKFRQTVKNLQTTMHDYDKQTLNRMKNMQDEIIEKEIQKIPKNLILAEQYDLEDQIHENVEKKVHKQIMTENKTNLEKATKNVMKEFKELGFELRYDFSDVMLK